MSIPTVEEYNNIVNNNKYKEEQRKKYLKEIRENKINKEINKNIKNIIHVINQGQKLFYVKIKNNNYLSNFEYYQIFEKLLKSFEDKGFYFIVKNSNMKINISCTLTFCDWYKIFYCNSESFEINIIPYPFENEQCIYSTKKPINLYKSEECVVCMKNKVKYYFDKCGHFCTCEICAIKLKRCPMCRKRSGIRSFSVNKKYNILN